MPHRRQSRHAFKPTAAKGNLFGLLPSELRKEIIDKVRKDRLGNETVPGHVAGAQLRGTCKELRDGGYTPAEIIATSFTAAELREGVRGRRRGGGVPKFA